MIPGSVRCSLVRMNEKMIREEFEKRCPGVSQDVIEGQWELRETKEGVQENGAGAEKRAPFKGWVRLK